MAPWVCGIVGCGEEFRNPEDLIRHQSTNHPRCECKVCGQSLPEGYLAIRHAFNEHTRAEYVRAYDADSDDIRLRERVKELIESHVDVPSLMNHLEGDERTVSVGD